MINYHSWCRNNNSSNKVRFGSTWKLVNVQRHHAQARWATSNMRRPLFFDSIFEHTATRFLRSIHRITHRMPAKLRTIEKQRVLVVAAHPDDEVTAVGGNLALHQRLGSAVLTLFVTLDAPAADVGRQGEAERAARLLGFDHRFLGFPDGSVSLHEPALARVIAEAIRSF